MRKFFALLPLLAAFAFAPADVVTTPDSEVSLEVLACNAPPTPQNIIGTTSAPYRACAVYYGGYPSGIDGYEWTISGGTITGGQGTNCIDYNAHGSSVTLCVKAFTYNSNGTKCYSGTYCQTRPTSGSGCSICE